jgi:ribosome maturation protein SDO1
VTHTSAANSPQLIVLDKAKYPKAVCNDGTAGAYVLRPGAGPSVNRWIISLQGGGECFDQASCATRAMTMPTLLSTSSFQANPSSAFGQGGLLGTTPGNNPDFYDASIVQVLYCSSDDWSGNKLSTTAFNANDPTTWNWEGRAILNATIADINASHGFSSATEVMLTGQSAGGVGTFANANPVAAMVPAAARYVAYSDAGFPDGGQDYLATGSAPNYTSSAQPTQTAKRILGLPLWNGTGDPICSAATPSDPLSQTSCYSGQALLASGTGTITLPMLVSVSEKDTNQLGTAGFPASAEASGATLTASQAGYLSYFSASMRSSVNGTNTNVSLFVPDFFVHVEATDPAYFNSSATFPSGNISLQQEVGAWYKAPCAVQRNVAN